VFWTGDDKAEYNDGLFSRFGVDALTVLSPGPSTALESRSMLDERAERFLNGPFAWIIGILCVVQFLLWAPSYLTWPYWADHDVFGVAAQSWDRGLKPYRDLHGNNFPGTIYIFWILGKLFGWGKPVALLEFDAILVAALGVLLAVWSRRCFGRALPGLVGFASFLSYYFALDYSQVAQRDWQGPCFAAFGFLIAQAWPRRRSARWISAGLTAVAFWIRPQVVLFAPALLLSIVEGARSSRPDSPTDEQPTRNGFASAVEWCLVLGGALVILALPLVFAGVLGDFTRSLGRVGLGSRYNRLTIGHFGDRMLLQISPLKFWLLPSLILLLGGIAGARRGDPARAWLLAFACVVFYRPMSRLPHAYLGHPLALTNSVLAAIFVARVSGLGPFPATARVTVILLTLGLSVSLKPRFCNPNGSLRAVAELRRGGESVLAPPGYVHNPDVPASAQYSWEDYRDVLTYLRTSTAADATIANALKHVPAINSSIARLSPFPAESIAWLIMVAPEDEPAFAESLRRSTNSLVVWAPSEKDAPGLIAVPVLTSAIEELYELDRRFGAIEVWRRKPTAQDRDHQR
jgi:hypothetical protein